MLLDLTLDNLSTGCWPVLERWVLCKSLWRSASLCCVSIRVHAVIAGLWSTVARNKAIAEAEAIDLSPVKVLIFGAGPKGPQHLQSSLPRAESIFTEADTEKKREGESRRGEENRGVADVEATYKHCWPAFLTLASLYFCFTMLPLLCIQMYMTDKRRRLQLSMCSISRRGTKTPVWVKLPPSIPLLSSGQAELLSNSQSLSLAHCLLPTQQPCEHLCEHSSLISQPHVFKLSPPLSLLLSHSPISLFASPVVIYVVVSMEHWLGAKQALPPHGHLLGSKNSTGQPQYLCVQTYRSSGMQAPQGSGCPVE